jgi:predicted phage-related endonuclease
LRRPAARNPEDISDKWAVIRGNALENELRKRFRANHPEMLVTDGTDKQFISREKPYLRASLDGILQGEDGSFGILEIKTASSRRAGDWHDEEGNLRIPPYYLAQVEFYALVTGWTWGYVYAAIGDDEPVEIPFKADVEDMGLIDKAAADFWHFVTSGTPPQLTGGDVQKAFPEPTPDIVDESADDDLYALLARYESAIRMLNDLKATQKALQEQIILRIGSHTGVRCGNLQATYKPTTRREYTVKAATYRKFAFKAIEEKEQ